MIGFAQRFDHAASLLVALALALVMGCSTESKDEWVEPTQRVLQLTGPSTTVEDIARRVQAATMRHVRDVRLANMEVGDHGLAVLARSPHLGSVEEMALVDTGMTNVGLGALAAARELSPSRLRLSGTTFDHRGLNVFLHSPVASALTELDIHQAPVGDEGASSLVASPAAERLVDLRWATYVATDAAVRMLTGTTRFKRLKRLELNGTCWRSASLLPLADPRNLPKLEALMVLGFTVDPKIRATIESARPGLTIIDPSRRTGEPPSSTPFKPTVDCPAAAPSSPRPAPARPAGAATSPADPPPRGD